MGILSPRAKGAPIWSQTGFSLRESPVLHKNPDTPWMRHALNDVASKLMQHKRSLWRGALISPWVVPVGLALVLGVLGLIGSIVTSEEHVPADLGAGFWLLLLIVVFGVPFTYIVTFVFVVPMVLLLRSLKALSAARLCLWCALLSPSTMYAYAWLLKGQPEKVLQPLGLAMGATYGLISGAAFCWASRVRLFARRPDK